MKNTGKQTRTKATPGFAIEIRDEAGLGNTILMAEIKGGCYQWIGAVVSINEGCEIAECDMRLLDGGSRARRHTGLPPCYLM